MNETEKILYYIWILIMTFISISAVLSEIYDKMYKNELPKFKREGKRLIRIWRENERNLYLKIY